MTNSRILRKVWLETGILGSINIILDTHVCVCMYEYKMDYKIKILLMQCNAITYQTSYT